MLNNCQSRFGLSRTIFQSPRRSAACARYSKKNDLCGDGASPQRSGSGSLPSITRLVGNSSPASFAQAGSRSGDQNGSAMTEPGLIRPGHRGDAQAAFPAGDAAVPQRFVRSNIQTFAIQTERVVRDAGLVRDRARDFYDSVSFASCSASRSAADSPLDIQSGMPTPEYAFPASSSPSLPAISSRIRATRSQ